MVFGKKTTRRVTHPAFGELELDRFGSWVGSVSFLDTVGEVQLRVRASGPEVPAWAEPSLKGLADSFPELDREFEPSFARLRAEVEAQEGVLSGFTTVVEDIHLLEADRYTVGFGLEEVEEWGLTIEVQNGRVVAEWADH